MRPTFNTFPGQSRPLPRRRFASAAFTLIELLVSMAITLIMVYAIAEFYAYVGKSVADGRGVIEMGGLLRGISLRLRQDLNSLTLSEVNPPVDPTKAAGYFEIVECVRASGGQVYPGATDADPEGSGLNSGNEKLRLTRDDNNSGFPDMIESIIAENSTGVTNLIGDGDDILAMTVRSQGEPFSGRYFYRKEDPPGTVKTGYETITSNLAEVIWFTAFVDQNGDGVWSADEPRTLVRRVLLIQPTLRADTTSVAPQRPNLVVPNANNNCFSDNDISAHYSSTLGWIPNTLADVTNPENRFLHSSIVASQNGLQMGNLLPNNCQLQPFNSNSVQTYGYSGDLGYENVMVQNLLAFDVRVWDPLAPIVANDVLNINTAVGLTPSDVGFSSAVIAGSTTPLGRGAYVDLGYSRKLVQMTPVVSQGALQTWLNNNAGLFGGDGNICPNLLNVAGRAAGGFNNRGSTYDTWTTAYERDGLDQFGDGVGDIANDGLDNDGVNGVDDPGERETQAPYPFALRGVQIRIRLYEPGTRQTRQATVAMDFLEE